MMGPIDPHRRAVFARAVRRRTDTVTQGSPERETDYAEKAAEELPRAGTETAAQAARAGYFRAAAINKRRTSQTDTPEGQRAPEHIVPPTESAPKTTAAGADAPSPQTRRKELAKNKRFYTKALQRQDSAQHTRRIGAFSGSGNAGTAAGSAFRHKRSDMAARSIAAVGRILRSAAAGLMPALLVGALAAVVVVLFGMAAAAVTGPMAILAADESGVPGTIPLTDLIAETNAGFAAELEALIAAHPECTETILSDRASDGRRWDERWPDVLALYAVAAAGEGKDVFVIDANKKAEIQALFREMHEISWRIEAEEISGPEPPDGSGNETAPLPEDTAPLPTPQVRHTLYVEVTCRPLEEMAEQKQLTEEQKVILSELVEMMRTELQ